jgi:prevent-host-death family protein
MYMSKELKRVGIAELRQNLSRFLKLVADGDRIVVTDHNKPVAEIGPPTSGMTKFERLIAQGIIEPAEDPTGFEDWEPLPPYKPGEKTLTEILLEMRDEERW